MGRGFESLHACHFNNLQARKHSMSNGPPIRGSRVRISPGVQLTHWFTANQGALDFVYLELGCIRGANSQLTFDLVA
ncbi:hypothetical protein SBA2_990002 [Acidobacteriia bacterium SbA2]|nr:hypothetical protein SBA2_990002 [Acidobacteriia bacterium SbA2]